MNFKKTFGRLFVLLVLISGCSGLFPEDETSSSSTTKFLSGDLSENETSSPINKQWSTLLGSSSYDIGYETVVDPSGNVYVTGGSRGDFDTHTNAGKDDMFLVKYNSSGTKQWSTLLGSSGSDSGHSVSVDSSGNVYVTGWSRGDFDSHMNSGENDIFLVKYNSSGAKQWSTLFGSSGTDSSGGISVDSSGNVYVTGTIDGDFDGHTNSGSMDMFLVKYDSSGAKQWSTLLGTALNDYGSGVSIDASGSVYVVGFSYGDFDGHINADKYQTDMLLVKYDSSGTKQWSTLLGANGDDFGFGVSVDSSGKVYVTGTSQGNFDGHTKTKGTYSGDYDMFLVQYSSSGTKQWSTLLGTSSWDVGEGVSIDSSGNVYVTGYSGGDFDGHMNSGDFDMFLMKYNSGTKQWSTLLGTTSRDVGNGISVDSSGSIYVAGYSEGNLYGHTNSGAYDMFLVKYSEVDE